MEYVLLLTDRRAIFVPEVDRKATNGGRLEPPVAHAPSEPGAVDHTSDPSELAGRAKSLTIPYEGIVRLEMSRAIGGYRLAIAYVRPDGVRKRLVAIVAPPLERTIEDKAIGIRPRQTRARYAENTRSAWESAMPPTMSAKAVWRL